MITSRVQALELAQLGADQGTDPQVVSLARELVTKQEPRVEELQALLTTWGQPVPGIGRSGGYQGFTGTPLATPMTEPSASPSPSPVPGAVSPSEVEALRQATGAQFDDMFVELMIRQDRAMIALARDEIAQGRSGAAKGIAQEASVDLRAEIDHLEALGSQDGA
jgi:uncharacterized protein (DUF305 family)